MACTCTHSKTDLIYLYWSIFAAEYYRISGWDKTRSSSISQRWSLQKIPGIKHCLFILKFLICLFVYLPVNSPQLLARLTHYDSAKLTWAVGKMGFWKSRQLFFSLNARRLIVPVNLLLLWLVGLFSCFLRKEPEALPPFFII